MRFFVAVLLFLIMPSEYKNPITNSKSLPGVRMVIAMLFISREDCDPKAMLNSRGSSMVT